MSGRLVISFHDLHPGTRAEAERFAAWLRAGGLGPACWLVVPRWHGGPRFDADRDFVALLGRWRDAGHEIVPHGWRHAEGPRARRTGGGALGRRLRAFYTTEGEFRGLGPRAAARRLAAGVALLRRAGFAPRGYVPPAWLAPPSLAAAAAAAGLDYLALWPGLVLLPGGRRLRAPPLAWSTRAPWRVRASRAWAALARAALARRPLCRVDVHPADLRHPEVEASVRAAILALAPGREILTAAELARREGAAR